MTEKQRNSILPKWQVTATTIECCHIGDFVTILVYKDWSSKCTWWAKHQARVSRNPGYRHAREVAGKVVKCEGPECNHVRGYIDKLIEEENGLSLRFSN